MDRQRKTALRSLEKRLDIKFKNLALLDESLTHSSFVNEKGNKAGRDNEGLEFLGDAVLGMVVSHHLYKLFPSYPPGEYSTLKAALVNKSTLAQYAREISLGKYLKLGRGEELSHGRDRDSVLADALEAVIGALFVDQGLDAVRKFILKLVSPWVEELGRRKERRDPKSLLQNIAQERFKTLPEYRVVSVTGPDHKRKFEVELVIKREVYGKGTGGSKKAAEQTAAREALPKLEADVDEASASEQRSSEEDR
ncbi:MAG: ribonuclease III [Candidatus Hydrogenedentes bacterium]|nr:ribonuclease III [Candidatus Hydrogenedentota bacterium]